MPVSAEGERGLEAPKNSQFRVTPDSILKKRGFFEGEGAARGFPEWPALLAKNSRRAPKGRQ